jgi:hypothetical protein
MTEPKEPEQRNFHDVAEVELWSPAVRACFKMFGAGERGSAAAIIALANQVKALQERVQALLRVSGHESTGLATPVFWSGGAQ